MKRKLKTWEKFVEEFKPLVDEWNEDDASFGNLHVIVKYNDNITWRITKDSKKIFGRWVEVKAYNENQPYFTHKAIINDNLYFFHKLWFEPEFKPIEFLSEEDFKL